MGSKPRVSVIIPTFNTGKYIAQAVESVLDQTYNDYEIIVVDDGSNDNTSFVLAPYIGRLRYIRTENQERSKARNLGIKLAQGDLIAFLDADDIWLPNKLEYQVQALDSHDEVVLAYCFVQTVDTWGTITSFDGSTIMGYREAEYVQRISDKESLFRCTVPAGCSSAVVRRTALDQAGNFDTQLTLGEDWELWARLGRIGPFLCVPDVLCQYRIYNWEKELRKRASDYLVQQYTYIIHKIARSSSTPISNTLLNQAEAKIKLESSIASFQLGDENRGRTLLNDAIEQNPLLASRKHFSDILENRARRIYFDTKNEAKVLDFLDLVIKNKPENVKFPKNGAKKILSRIYISEVFTANSIREYQTVRKVLWPAIRSDPSWLFNRGILSITFRSLLKRYG